MKKISKTEMTLTLELWSLLDWQTKTSKFNSKPNSNGKITANFKVLRVEWIKNPTKLNKIMVSSSLSQLEVTLLTQLTKDQSKEAIHTTSTNTRMNLNLRKTFQKKKQQLLTHFSCKVSLNNTPKYLIKQVKYWTKNKWKKKPNWLRSATTKTILTRRLKFWITRII